MVTLVRQGSALQLFLNGVADGSIVSFDTPLFKNDCVIGKTAGGVDFWGGQIDDVRFYGRALAPIEVTSLYKLESPPVSLPEITTQPQTQSVVAGKSVTFGVVTKGMPPISFQWIVNGATIHGATSNIYTVANVQIANAGFYSVLVSGPAGTIASSAGALNILNPPALTVQPQNQSAAVGGSVTFTVKSTGASPLTHLPPLPDSKFPAHCPA